MLCGLLEPKDFATTSWMPSASNTARIGPPAITPVPGGAARSCTLPEPKRPNTSWCSVRPSRSGTRTMLRRACDVALAIASGTSRAFAEAWPILPLPSPTTTSAAKPKRLPPFTTLATRLMLTRRSMISSCSSRSLRLRSVFSLRAILSSYPLEIQASFAGTIGQSLDASMIQERAAVKDHLLHAFFRGALRDQFADFFRGFRRRAGFQLALELFVNGAGGGDRVAVRVI